MEAAVRSSDLVPISDARRLAWAVLSRAASGPSRALWQLVDELGVENAAAAVAAGDVPVAVDGKVLERGDPDLAARDLETLHRIGGRLLTPEDPEWPIQRLEELHTRTNVHADYVAPLALWVRGSASLHAITEAPVVAFVGSGVGSGYGDTVTTRFVEDLHARGWTICSAGTMGIASRAHRVALASAAPTVAVLACGIDRAYLQHNQSLVEQIATAGLLVTEYPPQTPIRRSRARARARLVAGFADAVVAIEAGRGSLARQAVFWASRLDRAAYAVPGPVTYPESAGCHDLIAMDAAELVTTAADIPHPQYWADRAGVPEARVSSRAWVEELRAQLTTEFPQVRLWMHLTATHHLVVTTLIVAPESRERGIGSTVVRQILACAEQQGVAVAATPSRDYGANLARLRRFFRRHGFVPNRGARHDFTCTETMIRPPRPPRRTRRNARH